MPDPDSHKSGFFIFYTYMISITRGDRIGKEAVCKTRQGADNALVGSSPTFVSNLSMAGTAQWRAIRFEPCGNRETRVRRSIRLPASTFSPLCSSKEEPPVEAGKMQARNLTEGPLSKEGKPVEDWDGLLNHTLPKGGVGQDHCLPPFSEDRPDKRAGVDWKSARPSKYGWGASPLSSSLLCVKGSCRLRGAGL